MTRCPKCARVMTERKWSRVRLWCEPCDEFVVELAQSLALLNALPGAIGSPTSPRVMPQSLFDALVVE